MSTVINSVLCHDTFWQLTTYTSWSETTSHTAQRQRIFPPAKTLNCSEPSLSLVLTHLSLCRSQLALSPYVTAALQLSTHLTVLSSHCNIIHPSCCYAVQV